MRTSLEVAEDLTRLARDHGVRAGKARNFTAEGLWAGFTVVDTDGCPWLIHVTPAPGVGVPDGV